MNQCKNKKINKGKHKKKKMGDKKRTNKLRLSAAATDRRNPA
jgi:hypothetical protein